MDKRRTIRGSDLPQRRLTVAPEELLRSTPFKAALDQMFPGDDPRPEYRYRPSKWVFTTPPPMKPVARDQEDFTGQRWGRIVVLGVLDKGGGGGPSRKASWVVRCSCGNYETRNASAIRRKSDPDECCSDCGRFRQLKRRQELERDGKLEPRTPKGGT